MIIYFDNDNTATTAPASATAHSNRKTGAIILLLFTVHWMKWKYSRKTVHVKKKWERRNYQNLFGRFMSAAMNVWRLAFLHKILLSYGFYFSSLSSSGFLLLIAFYLVLNSWKIAELDIFLTNIICIRMVII